MILTVVMSQPSLKFKTEEESQTWLVALNLLVHLPQEVATIEDLVNGADEIVFEYRKRKQA